jgi:hypothetical protein
VSTQLFPLVNFTLIDFALLYVEIKITENTEKYANDRHGREK